MPAGSLPMKYIREPFEYKMKALRNPSKGVVERGARRGHRPECDTLISGMRHRASWSE